MARSRRDAPAIQTFADHEVIVPEHKLNRALTMTGRDIGPDVDAIARAEAALEELATEFPDWMRAECDRLDAARLRIKSDGLGTAARAELFRASHDIKGEAATFGYPLAAEAADSLCRLIEHTPDPARIPLTLVEQHVDGIRAIIREGAKEMSDRVGLAMVARLRQVTDGFLIEANKHRPDYLETVVTAAPPLAPKR